MSHALSHLYQVLSQYHLLSQATWDAYQACCDIKTCAQGEVLYHIGTIPHSFCFIHHGLMRAYTLDKDGNQYNKNFFSDGRFPGAMSALLQNTPSFLQIEAMEETTLIEINFAKFRELLFQSPDLMALHIHYLETHWLIEKEPKELSYLQFEAKERYQKFLIDFHEMLPRIPQYHIASYLGITPTQLSRIKKSLNQHM